MKHKWAHFNYRGCNSNQSINSVLTSNEIIFAFDNVNIRDVPYLMIGLLEQKSFR